MQFLPEKVIFLRVKRTVFSVFLSVCCMLSTLSVLICVGYHLITEHYINTVQPEHNEGTSVPQGNSKEDLPRNPPVDENGLTFISDTSTVQNFLLIGTDARIPGQSCRSDAMILISLNRESKKIVACSLLRDMLVTIEGHGKNRLNSAYSFGGPELLQKTLKDQLNIDVTSYVSVDFSSFSQIIDLLGGVEISVSASEVQVMNELCRQMDSGVSKIPLKDGTYHLNGVQALAYARNRSSADGDFDRTQRQRNILNALMKKMKTASVFDLLNLFSVILPNVTTNIPKDRLKFMIFEFPEYLNYQPTFTSIPQKGTFSFITFRKMSVIDVDFEANIRYLSEQIY